uniref:MULE transposase domain-containing protein n=1 Tax=Plectus sambesii TaxID=2011161 RepID=A0A914UH86_9BILA
MPHDVIEEIEGYLQEGWTPQSIVQKIQQKSDENSRQHYIRLKDVTYYLKSRLPERVFRFHAKDEISLDLMIAFYADVDGVDTPFLHYMPKTSENDNFQLAMQTPSMRKMLDRFGHKVICVDSTHETTMYPEYVFGTVMVIDDSGAGQPVFWFFVRSESKEQLVPVFRKLQDRHPTLAPEFFMSNYANGLWNAWTEVFGDQSPSTKRLLCDWHTWRSWLKNINSKLAPDVHAQVRQALSLVMFSKNEEEFNFRYGVLVNNFMQDPMMKAFGDYFVEHYGGPMIHCWAKWARLTSDVSTNTHLESFHNILKTEFLSQMSNRRLDNTCGVLLNAVSTFYAHKYSDLVWIVDIIHCRFCAVCLHEFICECPRSRRGGNSPCSRIHSIQILFGIHHPPQRVPVNTPSSLTATVNDEVQSVADDSIPMELNTQDGNDAASKRSYRIEMVCKKVELLREKLARVKAQFISSTIGEEKIASVEAQLNQAFRLVNAISATNTSSLPVGRKGCRKKMIRQARSFQEMRIAKAKERVKQQRQSVLPLSKKRWSPKRDSWNDDKKTE